MSEQQSQPTREQLWEGSVDIKLGEHGRKAQKNAKALARLGMKAKRVEFSRINREDDVRMGADADDYKVRLLDGAQNPNEDSIEWQKVKNAEADESRQGKVDDIVAKEDRIADKHYELAIEDAATLHPQWAEGPSVQNVQEHKPTAEVVLDRK